MLLDHLWCRACAQGDGFCLTYLRAGHTNIPLGAGNATSKRDVTQSPVLKVVLFLQIKHHKAFKNVAI